MKTTLLNDADAKQSWYLLDAADKPAGRLAVKVTTLLRGKDSPSYTPAADPMRFVVVINARKVKLTGGKEETKRYRKYTGFPDGLKFTKAGAVRASNPGLILRSAVKGMLPKNHMSRRLYSRLKVYNDDAHPHAAQKPQAVDL